MNIKKLSYLLVFINLFFAGKELPLTISIFIFTAAILSIFIKNNKARTVIKLFILATSLAILKVSFKPLLVPEAGVSFILVLSALKLWELESDTDFYNMFLILALAEGTLFLLMPTLPMFIMGFLKTASFFYFLLKLRNYNLVLLSFRRILYLMVPALLFSVLLFYTFPRFTKGFSSTPNIHSFFTGASSKLNFSKLGPITPSTKIIFRAYGLTASPKLYWRSAVLWGNQGEEWNTSNLYNIDHQSEKVPAPTIDYQVRLANDFNEYLPTLDGHTKIKNSSEEFYKSDDGSFRLKNILKREIRFSASTNNQTSLLPFSKNMDIQGTRLISKRKNELTNDILGSNILETMDEKERLEYALTYFKNRRFEYSLTPPYYPSIEEFIKTGKTGYCSHFAAAFVYIARTLNLPSRIVIGFQGGEYNPFDQSVIVRELDGHAWTEVYLSSSGWKRIDATEFVAPARIAEGAKIFNEKLDPDIHFYYFHIPKSLLNFAFINSAALWIDAVNMRFNEVLMNFNKDEQLKLLKNLLPTFSLESLFAASLILPATIFFVLSYFLKNKKMSLEEKRYKNFLKKMKSYGIEKYPFETATAFQNRCLTNQSLSREKNIMVKRETSFYINLFYKS